MPQNLEKNIEKKPNFKNIKKTEKPKSFNIGENRSILFCQKVSLYITCSAKITDPKSRKS